MVLRQDRQGESGRSLRRRKNRYVVHLYDHGDNEDDNDKNCDDGGDDDDDDTQPWREVQCWTPLCMNSSFGCLVDINHNHGDDDGDEHINLVDDGDEDNEDYEDGEDD